jgi:hypothetical protein
VHNGNPTGYFLRMSLRDLFYPILALAFSGCNLFSGKCTYELRSLDAAGQLNQSGGAFATAQVTLSEQRGSLQGQSIAWLVTGDALKGHVTSASIKDSSSPSQVLLNLPIATADRPEISQGAASSNMGANLAGFHDILAAGHGIVELQTDDSSQPTVTISLTPTSVGDWIRPYCS